MTWITQLVSTCIDNLHLSGLVDAYAELIQSKAFFERVSTFFPFAFLIAAVAIAIVASIADVLKKKKKA